MPNIKSAKKRLRQNEVRRVENLDLRSRMRTMGRRFRESLEPESTVPSDEAYRKYCSALDKAAKKGVIAQNTANRNKRKATLKLRDVETTTGE